MISRHNLQAPFFKGYMGVFLLYYTVFYIIYSVLIIIHDSLTAIKYRHFCRYFADFSFLKLPSPHSLNGRLQCQQNTCDKPPNFSSGARWISTIIPSFNFSTLRNMKKRKAKVLSGYPRVSPGIRPRLKYAEIRRERRRPYYLRGLPMYLVKTKIQPPSTASIPNPATKK